MITSGTSNLCEGSFQPPEIPEVCHQGIRTVWNHTVDFWRSEPASVCFANHSLIGLIGLPNRYIMHCTGNEASWRPCVCFQEARDDVQQYILSGSNVKMMHCFLDSEKTSRALPGYTDNAEKSKAVAASSPTQCHIPLQGGVGLSACSLRMSSWHSEDPLTMIT